jgi:hypothetical protein
MFVAILALTAFVIAGVDSAVEYNLTGTGVVLLLNYHLLWHLMVMGMMPMVPWIGKKLVDN